MDELDHDSDSEPSEIVEHKGYTYEKKWKANVDAVAAHEWVHWKCVERSCAGQIATAAVRTKRWRRQRFAVHRDVASNRLMAFVPQRPHNHAPMTAHRNETSRQIGTATVKQTPVPSPSTSSTNALAAPSFEMLNEINAFHLSETKSSLSLTDTENINSINLDNVSKSMDTVGKIVTTFDNGIKISNVNDTMELQAVKPVNFIDHQINSEESHLKDISITVDGTNSIDNIEKKNFQIQDLTERSHKSIQDFQ